MEEFKNIQDILNEDDRILFSLEALGGVKKYDKLVQKGELLSVDDRWFFQGFQRWWSDDSREKSSGLTLVVISKANDRVQQLLDDYKTNKNTEKRTEYFEEEEIQIYLGEKKRLINKYLIALSKAKAGVQNCYETYNDKFTKNKFNMSLIKIEDILNTLNKFEF